jgi:hypothetical protein
MLKKVIVCVAVTFAGLGAVRDAAAADWVRGYYRSSGTYVQPHYRSHADGNFYNNWSTHPNVNPYTGQTGTRRTPSYGTGHSSAYGLGYPSYRSNYSASGGYRGW